MKNENNYPVKTIKRTIFISWILLIICFAIKIFGYNLCDFYCKSEKFINLCHFVDENKIMYFSVCIFTSILSYGLYYLAIIKQTFFSKSQIVIFVCITISCVFIRNYLKIYRIAGYICDIFQFFIVPYILNGNKMSYKKMSVRVIIAFLLNLSFQAISLFTKSIGVKPIGNNTVTVLIWMIDVFIMLFLYYLYQNI